MGNYPITRTPTTIRNMRNFFIILNLLIIQIEEFKFGT